METIDYNSILFMEDPVNFPGIIINDNGIKKYNIDKYGLYKETKLIIN